MASKIEPNANTGELKEAIAGAAGPEDTTGHKNMLRLIQLRWIAVIGQITTIAVVMIGFGIHLPLPHMLMVLACLIAFNIGSHLRWHERTEVSNNELFLALLVDVGSLTAQLYLSGGTANPFAFLFLLQVILSAVLLEAWSTWTIVAITSACLAGLSLFSEPLRLPADHGNGLASLYVDGMLLCFAMIAALLVFFVTRINHNLRAGDAQLADLRQRAAEEDHIVRMGLLASGAAHELGTPLATLSVILGDWRRMPEFSNNSELLEEISEMQTQLQRCKSIVSGILLSAGEARGESSVKTTISTFLNDLAKEWCTTRPIVSFAYENRIQQDMPVVFDSALKQMICNVLDNALEASPQWVSLEATREGDSLILQVTDAGPGFVPAMLNHIGKPYQSSKGRPGSGLGLFFVVNVARKLGGVVSARNRSEGGAEVRLTLPLAAISLEEEIVNVG
ncbi:histidine kinase-, DNA gyrase B-, and HSP90-like ATPase family protein [Collimonas arenae]|uniref:histidine kinase n=1 Tax=Collimonas arenae TaxID=279058 RepID=A0A127PQN2_9BURK|nr:ATP-binding protein [Collimonas arenae]AMP00083.1 histidine kinase-, DNA gyrase B-, and HSP90-like ATPase family protein [Collimonas arenae]AMP09980.1 histidine kinase-, DNA gyrase B-, and HSP90-like ATPase family protein [Collimonas arenae]